MNKYEHLSILTEKLNKTEYTREVKNLTKQFKNISEINELGLKHLAYEVQKNKNAYYVAICFKGKNIDIARIEKYCKNNSNILKYLTIRVDD